MNREIIPNLWQVGGANLTHSGDAAAYLIVSKEEAALIDAGTGENSLVLEANIKACLPTECRLKYCLLTHCHFDHTGGASRVRKTFGCQLVAHELDAIYLETGDSEVTAASWYGSEMEPLTIDHKLSGSLNRVQIGKRRLTAIHWPGHSPGSLVYTAELGDTLVLFGQDVHGPLHPLLLSDHNLYQQSLRNLLTLDADLLLEGHYGIFSGKEKVKNFIASFIV